MRQSKAARAVTAKTKIAIACQGGGSQTAFTAGALKALCEAQVADEFEIVSMSGTSGGAVCAVLVWHALERGEARPWQQLIDFWQDNSAKGWAGIAFNQLLVNSVRMINSGLLPTFQLSPASPVAQSMMQVATMGLREKFTSFKALLEAHVDFAEIASWGPRAKRPVLMVGAANVTTGMLTKFISNREPIRVEHVRAMLALEDKVLDMRGRTVDLTLVVERVLQLGRHLDAGDVIGLVGRRRERFRNTHRHLDVELAEELGPERMGQQHVVEHLDVPQLLEEGDVALQLIAAVDDIVDAHRYRLAPGRIDLDQPDLLGNVLRTDAARADELLHRRIVGEQAVPEDIPADLHGGKDSRHRAGGERGRSCANGRGWSLPSRLRRPVPEPMHIGKPSTSALWSHRDPRTMGIGGSARSNLHRQATGIGAVLVRAFAAQRPRPLSRRASLLMAHTDAVAPDDDWAYPDS